MLSRARERDDGRRRRRSKKGIFVPGLFPANAKNFNLRLLKSWINISCFVNWKERTGEKKRINTRREKKLVVFFSAQISRRRRRCRRRRWRFSFRNSATYPLPCGRASGLLDLGHNVALVEPDGDAGGCHLDSILWGEGCEREEKKRERT